MSQEENEDGAKSALDSGSGESKDDAMQTAPPLFTRSNKANNLYEVGTCSIDISALASIQPPVYSVDEEVKMGQAWFPLRNEDGRLVQGQRVSGDTNDETLLPRKCKS